MYNLIIHPTIAAAPLGYLTLPGVLAALARDEVDDFPALRPHQAMFWHMALVQLAALGLHHAGAAAIPTGEERWREVLRSLTPDFPEDEPWSLAVEDWSKPAFMQAAVPAGCKLDNPAPTADALDLLITSKNHDLKQAVARFGEPQDWLFALVSLQTGEGYGGARNYGIARMNGGSSSRPMMALAPLPTDLRKTQTPRLGAWFRRDVQTLLATREKEQQAAFDYPDRGGLGLIWLAPWPEGEQLPTRSLDRWFIEICRRVRLQSDASGQITARKGKSTTTRIDAKHLKGATGDPWTPVHKVEAKGFTLGDGDFDYGRVIDLAMSGNWALPLLAKLGDADGVGQPLTLVVQALARGNSRTDGFKSRLIPLEGRVAQKLGGRDPALFELAREHAQIVADFSGALKGALALVAAGGERAKRKREHYKFANEAGDQLHRFADTTFFVHLWERLDASDSETAEKVRLRFVEKLWRRTQAIFNQALPTVPCGSLPRPRAEARGCAALQAMVRKKYGADFVQIAKEAQPDAA